jgi:hypothetical protein
VNRFDLDPERSGERRQPALAHERGELPRQRDRAEHRRAGPVQPAPVERLAQYAHVEARVVGDQHPSLHARGELGQDGGRLGRRVDHRLRDPGEALDAAPQRKLRANHRLPRLVQLAPADEHTADLGELALVAPEPVGLGVDGEELGGRERLVAQIHGEHLSALGGRHAYELAFGGEAVHPRP